MPKITFTETDKSFDVEAGTSLVEFIQANDTPVPLGCANGACGTCASIVEAAEGAVQAAEEDETNMLKHSTDNPKARLCCLLTVQGDISISPI